MGHNCVEGPDTPAVAASRCPEQMNSTRGRSGWCHRTPLLCPTSAGSLTNQSSGRKLAAGARSPAGPVKISLPGSRRHFSSADTIWQRRVTWPRDMSWRHRVTCRDVTRHSICHKSTHYPPPWPRPTRADRLRDTDLKPRIKTVPRFIATAQGDPRPETRESRRRHTRRVWVCPCRDGPHFWLPCKVTQHMVIHHRFLSRPRHS